MMLTASDGQDQIRGVIEDCLVAIGATAVDATYATAEDRKTLLQRGFGQPVLWLVTDIGLVKAEPEFVDPDLAPNCTLTCTPWRDVLGMRRRVDFVGRDRTDTTTLAVSLDEPKTTLEADAGVGASKARRDTIEELTWFANAVESRLGGVTAPAYG
jgi:hypothetical protein